MEKIMKKLLVFFGVFSVFVMNVSAATSYDLYYKTSQYGSWTKAGNYYSEGACERAASSSYSWAYATKCNIVN